MPSRKFNLVLGQKIKSFKKNTIYNMNAFLLITDFIRDCFRSNSYVKTILFARTEEKDLYKKNIYPLVHINPVSAPLNSSYTNTFTYEIGVFDQRDISDDQIIDKFEGNDNLQDNLNITYSILDSFIKKLRNENNTLNIELVSVSDASPLLYSDINLLDGWFITVTLSIPTNNCD